jgi:hypothetical protein
MPSLGLYSRTHPRHTPRSSLRSGQAAVRHGAYLHDRGDSLTQALFLNIKSDSEKRAIH